MAALIEGGWLFAKLPDCSAAACCGVGGSGVPGSVAASISSAGIERSSSGLPLDVVAELLTSAKPPPEELEPFA